MIPNQLFNLFHIKMSKLAFLVRLKMFIFILCHFMQIRSLDHSKKFENELNSISAFHKGLYDKINLCIVKLLKKKNLYSMGMIL